MNGRKKGKQWWAGTVSRFEKSGLTQAKFSRLAGVDRGTLRKWLRRVTEDRARDGSGESGDTLVRVEFEGWGAAAPSGPRVLVAGLGPAELRFEEGTECTYVGAVVASIARALGRC